VHDEQKDYDLDREEILAGFGCRVLRFRNEQVEREIEVVLAGIYDACQMRLEVD